MGNEDTVPMFHFSVSRFSFLVSRFTNIPTTLASHPIFFFSFLPISLDFYRPSESGALDWSKKLSLDLLTSLADGARSGWTCSVREGPDFIPTALLTRKTNKLISNNHNNNNNNNNNKKKTARRRNNMLRGNSQESSFLWISRPQES